MSADISSEPKQELILDRFMGRERYKADSAEWNLYKDEDLGRMNLWLAIDCSEALEQFEDTEYINMEPNWELNLIEDKISVVQGFTANIPLGYDESRDGWITNFYSVSHDGSDKNRIEVVEVEGDRVRFRLSGEIVDPNYYDDSKPRTKVYVDAWFTKVLKMITEEKKKVVKRGEKTEKGIKITG